MKLTRFVPSSIMQLLLAMVMITAILPSAIAQERYAVVIGVSEYPSLPKSLWLRGPRNDARLVRDYLISNPAAPFKPENIITLADGIEGAILPTLGAIRKAMDDTANRVKEGDLVYLHFSGHGTQAPAGENSGEIDGLDELFLPRDIGKWNFEVKSVENALVDDEIGQMIDKIRARGAFVWTVFDSCNSGTATRGAPVDDSIRVRKIAAADLGIPQTAMDKANDAVIRTRGGPTSRRQSMLGKLTTSRGGRGGLAAFFAAQTTETTPELRLPKGKKGRKTQGLFTFTLFQALAENPAMSYRQLAQEVLRRYGASYMNQPTPLFEGDLGGSVFGANAREFGLQWLVKADQDGELSLPAGQLHGLDVGARLMLLPSAASSGDATIGEVEVTSVETLSSLVKLVSVTGDRTQLMDKLETGLIARLLGKPLEFTLKVALPDMSNIGSTRLISKIQPILEGLSGGDDDGLRLTLVDVGEEAEIRLAISDEDSGIAAGHLWLLSTTGELTREGPTKTPSISLLDKSAEEAASALVDNLTRIARVTNLLKIGNSGMQASEIEVQLRTKRKGQKQLIDLDPASVPRLFPDDQVHIVAKNTSTRPVDINVLFLGSDYSISHMYSGRVHPGNTLKKGLFRVTSDSFGTERVLLITTPAKPQSLVEDLRFLAQKAVPATRGNGGFKSLLREAGFGQRTRGAVSLVEEDAQSSGIVQQFLIETAPR